MSFKIKNNYSSYLASALLIAGLSSCSEELVIEERDDVIEIENLELTIDENTATDTVISDIDYLTTGQKELADVSIASQSVANALKIVDQKLVVNDASMLDYETSPEITGDIEVKVGNITALASFTVSLNNLIETDGAFITTWETTSADEKITIYTYAEDVEKGIVYDYTVDWGDETTDENLTAEAPHIYTTPGVYTVTITGKFPGIKQNNLDTGINAAKLKTVEQWGENKWQSLHTAFDSCKDLVINDTSAPDLSEATTVAGVFQNATNFNSDISHWDMSTITNIGGMFRSATSFNQDIGAWDMSSVTGAHAFCLGASSFNQDISGWDMSNLEDASYMFHSASSFSQDLSGWDVSKVSSTTSFNGGSSILTAEQLPAFP